MKNLVYIFLLIGISGFAIQTPITDSKEALKVTSFVQNGSSIDRLGKYESTITLNKSWGNPYDYLNQIEINAYFNLPAGQITKVPGFWYEGFSRSLHDNTEQLEPTTTNGWKIRFAPKLTGTYQYYIEVIDHENNGNMVRYPSQGSLTFTSVASSNKGFLKVGKTDASYLEYEDGTPYIGLGHNLLGWEWNAYTNSKGTYDYDEWLKKLAENGANMAQFDFCEGDQIEWSPNADELPYSNYWQGLGRYNQQLSWKMDYIFSKAEQFDIFFRLTFSHWEDFDKETGDYPHWGWSRNPYNSVNGGPVDTTVGFFTDNTAKDFYKRYIRYIVARWGYSKNILTYELWNEADSGVMWGSRQIQKDNELTNLNWHREMSDYLKELDPDHLITTSFASNLRQDAVWELPNIGITTLHRYPHFNEKIDGGFKQFEVEPCLSYIIQKRALSNSKPILVGEFTVTPISKDLINEDPNGISFHNQLWVSIMQGVVGTAMHWYWGSYIDGQDLYYHYKPLSKYLEDEDLRNMSTFDFKTEFVDGYGLKSKNKAFIWVHDLKHTYIDRKLIPQLITVQTYELADMEDGQYTLTFFDTYKGTLISEQIITCNSSTLEIKIPDFKKDIAIKVKKKQK